MKKIILIIIVFALFLLTACTPSEPEIADIAADLENHPGFFNDYDVILNDIEIVKRQTNKDDKTDYIWVTAFASSDLLTCELGYYLEYILYNDGWILDVVLRDQNGLWSITSVKPTNEQMMADLRADEFINSKGLSVTNLSAAPLIEGNSSGNTTNRDDPAPAPPPVEPPSDSGLNSPTYPTLDTLPSLNSRTDDGDPFTYKNTVRIEAKNDDALFTVDYDITYHLERDGWKLQNSRVQDFRATPLTGISETELEDFIFELSSKNGYNSISQSNRNTDLSRFADEVTYTATTVHSNAEIERDIYMLVLFDQRQGEWIIQPNVEESEGRINWKLDSLIGEWNVSSSESIGNQGRSFTIKITAIDTTSIQASGNYLHTDTVYLAFSGASTFSYGEIDFDDVYQFEYDDTEHEFTFWIDSYEFKPWVDKYTSDIGVAITIDNIMLRDRRAGGYNYSVNTYSYTLSKIG